MIYLMRTFAGWCIGIRPVSGILADSEVRRWSIRPFISSFACVCDICVPGRVVCAQYGVVNIRNW